MGWFGVWELYRRMTGLSHGPGLGWLSFLPLLAGLAPFALGPRHRRKRVGFVPVLRLRSTSDQMAPVTVAPGPFSPFLPLPGHSRRVGGSGSFRQCAGATCCLAWPGKHVLRLTPLPLPLKNMKLGGPAPSTQRGRARPHRQLKTTRPALHTASAPFPAFPHTALLRAEAQFILSETKSRSQRPTCAFNELLQQIKACAPWGWGVGLVHLKLHECTGHQVFGVGLGRAGSWALL